MIAGQNMRHRRERSRKRPERVELEQRRASERRSGRERFFVPLREKTADAQDNWKSFLLINSLFRRPRSASMRKFRQLSRRIRGRRRDILAARRDKKTTPHR